MPAPAGVAPFASDALLTQLLPMWQTVIGLLVLVALVVATRRLVARGPSRMGAAMLVVGAAIVGIAAIGVLLQNL